MEETKKTSVQAKAAEKAKETATQKAACLAAAEKAKEKAARAVALEKQKAETREKHANAKSACAYNFYGVIHAESTATPFAACKHFYLDAQAACGGALCVVLRAIIGNDKRDFAERYADKVKEKAKSYGRTNYTPFIVWRVLWEDLKLYTRGQAKADAETAEAVEKLRAAMMKRAETLKAAKAAKAAAKAAAK